MPQPPLVFNQNKFNGYRYLGSSLNISLHPTQGCKLIRDEKGDNDANPLGGSPWEGMLPGEYILHILHILKFNASIWCTLTTKL